MSGSSQNKENLHAQCSVLSLSFDHCSWWRISRAGSKQVVDNWKQASTRKASWLDVSLLWMITFRAGSTAGPMNKPLCAAPH